MMSFYKTIIGTIFTATAVLLLTIVAPNSAAAKDDIDQSDSKAYWDRGNLLVNSYVDRTVKDISCGSTTKDNYAKKIKECILAQSYSEQMASSIKKIDSTVFIYKKGGVTENKNHPSRPVYHADIVTANVGTKNKITITCTIVPSDNRKTVCMMHFIDKVSSYYRSNGIRNGEAVYASDSEKNARIYINGNIQNASGSAEHLKGKGVIGEPYQSWQENYFYTEMKAMFNPTKVKYLTKCLEDGKGADCASSKERLKGAFSQIWRTCVVASGVIEADIQNATNCIHEYTGIRLNTEAMLQQVPATPQEILDANNCGVSTAGYIICPVMRFLGNTADKMFTLLTELLIIHPLDPNSPGGESAQRAWRVFVNIANIIFIILFMVLIFAQLTGFGLTNYNIKQLLPRLIIGAILVNISFYLCILIIDISNVLGKSIQDVMLLINDQIFSTGDEGIVLSANMAHPNNSTDASNWGAITEGILGAGILAGGVVATTALIFVFVPIMTAVVLSAVTVVLTLLIRYGLVLLLIIVAPIAFALYLLPNTKKWFTKWRTTFVGLLMLFPVISIIFGLSTLAANIIAQVAATQNSQMLAVFALAIQAIPLAVSPLILRSSGQTLGKIGDSIQNNNLFNKARGIGKNRQSDLNKNLQVAALNGKRVPFGGAIRANYKNKAKLNQRKATQRRMGAEYISNYLSGAEGSGGEKTSVYETMKSSLSKDYTPKTKAEKFQDRVAITGGDGVEDRVAAYALSSQHSILTDEIKANKLTMAGEDTPEVSADKVKNILDSRSGNAARSGADAVMLAAMENAVDGQDSLAVRTIVELSGVSMSDIERTMTANAAGRASVFMQGPEAKHAIATGQVQSRVDFNQKVIEPIITSGNFSASTVKTMSSDDKQILYDAYTSRDLSPNAMQSIKATAQESITNGKIAKTLNAQELRNFQAMAR